MKRNHLIIVSTFILFLIAIVWVIYKPTNSLLVTNNNVKVYKSLETALAKPPQKPMATLMTQERVEVIKNIDVKHYLIYKVRLLDGRIGFINEGEYILLKNTKK